MNFRIPSCASRLIEDTVWVKEIESAKSVSNLTHTITGSKLQTNFEVLGSRIASGVTWPNVGNFGIWRTNFRSSVSSSASRTIEEMIWIDETESAKSVEDVKYSH